MRLGQAVCDYVALVSDPEVRLCIVPLPEKDYLAVLEKVATVIGPDDLAHAAFRDRVQAIEILTRAIREESNLNVRVFQDASELTEALEQADIDQLIDQYNEMVEKSSPALDGIPQEEFEYLKKALQEMEWNDLSGRSWYAARRFLGTIMPKPLLDNRLGFTSTNLLTTTSDSDESTSGAFQNSSE